MRDKTIGTMNECIQSDEEGGGKDRNNDTDIERER